MVDKIKKFGWYKELPQYQQLKEDDKTTFDFLYPIIALQGYISDSNAQIMANLKHYVNYNSERSFREHLAVLIKTGLIDRELVRYRQGSTYVNLRYLYLNKYLFKEACLERPSNNYLGKGDKGDPRLE